MKLTLAQLAEIVQGTIAAGEPSLEITGFSTVDLAEPGDVTFLGNARYLPRLKKSRASAALVPPEFKEAPNGMATVATENPTLAFQRIIARYCPPKPDFKPGVHSLSVIAPGARLDRDQVFVGPHAVIEDAAEIGDGSAVHANAYIGHGARLGNDCVIHANAVIKDRCVLGNRVTIHAGTVIGTDGFGYEFSEGRHVKLEQLGIVQIDDDVEVGSCTTIDRARFGRTWIGEGTKIDNLVQIAHNCVIGKHCIICAQVGISGSTHVGDFVTMAGQVGVAGHLTIGDKVTFLAKSGVTKDYPEPGAYTGYPARPLMEGRRMLTYPAKVPEILERMRELEERLRQIEGDGSHHD